MPENRGAGGSKATASTANRSPSKWTITGVTAETREAVSQAAKKDEMAIGKWVDRTLREAAEVRLTGGRRSVALPPDVLHLLNEISQNVKALNERRSLGGQTLQQVQETASELGDQVSSAYEALIKRADPAIEGVRSRTRETWQETAKWRSSLLEQLRNARIGAERLQKLVKRQESEGKRPLERKQKAGGTGHARSKKGRAVAASPSDTGQ